MRPKLVPLEIQRSEPILDRLPKFQFVDCVHESGVRRELRRDLGQNFFRAHPLFF